MDRAVGAGSWLHLPYHDGGIQVHDGIGDDRRGGKLARVEALRDRMFADTHVLLRAARIFLKQRALTLVKPGQQLLFALRGLARRADAKGEDDALFRRVASLLQHALAQAAGRLDELRVVEKHERLQRW